jgi:hypothetical protein
MTWFKIDTAPKGVRVLVSRPKGSRVCRVGIDIFKECGGRECWNWSNDDFQPTHWQPLPEPIDG